MKMLLAVLTLAVALPQLVLGWAGDDTLLYPTLWMSEQDDKPKVYGRTTSSGGDTFYEFYITAPAGGGSLEDGSRVYLDLEADNFTDAFVQINITLQTINFHDIGGEKFYTVPSAQVTSINPNEIEFKLSGNKMKQSTGIDTLVDLDVIVDILYGGGLRLQEPQSYNFDRNHFTLYKPVDCTPLFEHRAAVVYSSDSEVTYGSGAKAYSDGFLTAQQHLYQAGIPHSRLTVAQFLDVSNACKYDMVVFHYLDTIKPTERKKFEKAFHFYMKIHKTAIVFSGELAARSTTGTPFGDPLKIQRTWLAVIAEAFETGNAELVVKDTTILKEYTVGEVLMDSSLLGTSVAYYKAVNDPSLTKTVCEIKINGNTKAAVTASEHKGIRVAHFAQPEQMVRGNILWRLYRWALQGNNRDIPVGLMMSRFDSMFYMRNDMDQSMFQDEAKILEPALLDLYIEPWFEKYNCVGSYYLNVGNRSGSEFNEETDWDWARDLYGQYMDIGNEIGSHSYTHPHDINALSPANLEYEFNQAQIVIKQELGLSRIGSAQPGVGDTLPTARTIFQYMETYWSGGYGFNVPHGFGFMDTTHDVLYFTPNIIFDFSIIVFMNNTVEYAEQYWQDQFDNITKGSNLGIIHFPVHDYSVGRWDDVNRLVGGSNTYSDAMFEGMIKKCFESNCEFVTGMGLHDRMRGLINSKLDVTKGAVPGEYYLQASIATQPTMGHFALKVLDVDPTLEYIQDVTNYYAFNNNSIFLPRVGTSGSFRMNLANAPDRTTQPTHIQKLDMRMELVSVFGDGLNINFTVTGQGKVEVFIKAGYGIESVTGADSVNTTALHGNQTVVLGFNDNAEHAVTLKVVQTTAPTNAPTLAPSLTPTLAPNRNPTTFSPTQAPVAKNSGASSGGSAGTIAGATLGGLAALAALGAAAVFMMKKRTQAAPVEDKSALVSGQDV